MRTSNILAASLAEVKPGSPFRRYIAFTRALNSISMLGTQAERDAALLALGPYEGRGHGRVRSFVRSLFSRNAAVNSRSKYKPKECDSRMWREFA